MGLIQVVDMGLIQLKGRVSGHNEVMAPYVQPLA